MKRFKTPLSQVSSISRGVCVLVGIGREDGAEDVEYITRKVLNMRIFQSEDGKKWDKSVKVRSGFHFETLNFSFCTSFSRRAKLAAQAL